MKIEKIKSKLVDLDSVLFVFSRSNNKVIVDYCNIIRDKVNEIIDVINNNEEKENEK